MRFLRIPVKIRHNLHVNSELTSQFLFSFASFFIVMTNNSLVNFKHIHFLLLIRASHQSPNFETFGYSGENLPNSSCYFWKYKSVFLQILHQYSVPSNIIPIYFFSSNIYTLVKSSSLKCKFFEIFKCSGQNLLKFFTSVLNWQLSSFSNFASFIIVIAHKPPVNFKLIYFLFWIKGPHESPNFWDVLRIFQIP